MKMETPTDFEVSQILTFILIINQKGKVRSIQIFAYHSKEKHSKDKPKKQDSGALARRRGAGWGTLLVLPILIALPSKSQQTCKHA